MNRRWIGWLVVFAIAAGAMLALATPAPTVKMTVTGGALAQLQDSGAWVIDVRTNAEYIAGHLPNALNVPLDQLPTAAATWPKDQPLVVYCATGERSAQAATYLSDQGFRSVYDLKNGIASWTGEVVGGADEASAPTGPGVVETSGRPVFIDFAGSA